MAEQSPARLAAMKLRAKKKAAKKATKGITSTFANVKVKRANGSPKLKSAKKKIVSGPARSKAKQILPNRAGSSAGKLIPPNHAPSRAKQILPVRKMSQSDANMAKEVIANRAGSSPSKKQILPNRAGSGAPTKSFVPGAPSSRTNSGTTSTVPIGKMPPPPSNSGVKEQVKSIGPINSTSPGKPSLIGSKLNNSGQGTPSGPQEGRSSSAPGRMKKVLGLQSARTLAPGAKARKVKVPVVRPGKNMTRS